MSANINISYLSIMLILLACVLTIVSPTKRQTVQKQVVQCTEALYQMNLSNCDDRLSCSQLNTLQAFVSNHDVLLEMRLSTEMARSDNIETIFKTLDKLDELSLAPHTYVIDRDQQQQAQILVYSVGTQPC